MSGKIGPGPWIDVMDDVPRFEPPDPVVEAVRADLLARSKVGLMKYGRGLGHLAHRDALQHAYEEALDFAAYLKQAMTELDA